MKHLLMLAVGLALATMASVVVAGAPMLINYQGRLTNSAGEPMDATVQMIFSICADSNGNACTWTEVHTTVVVTGGLFDVVLGSTTQLTDGDFSDTERWLGINVNGEALPYTRMVSVPYAFQVGSLEGAGGGIINGTLGVLGEGSKLGTDPHRHIAEPPLLWSPFIGAGWPAGFNPPSPPQAGFIHLYDAAGANVIDLDGSTGRIGVGTASPEAMLQVDGSVFLLGGNGDADLSTTVNTADLVLIVDHLESGTPLSPGQSAEADIDGDGRVTWDDAAILTRIFFQPETKTEAVRNIHSSYGAFSGTLEFFYVRGWAGIGTLAPTGELTVESAEIETNLILNNTGTNGRQWNVFSSSDGSPAGGGLFVIADNTAGGTGRLAIDADGDVGIGTTSPEAKLHVDGNVYFLGGDGDADLSGSVNATDITRIVDYLSQNVFLTPGEYAEADMDGDGRVTWDDLTILNRILFQSDTKPEAVRNINGSRGALSSTVDGFYVRGRVGIGTSNPEGALDVSSTTGALIVPRMTTTQRNALTPVNGMIIYNTTDNQFNFYENGAWVIK